MTNNKCNILVKYAFLFIPLLFPTFVVGSSIVESPFFPDQTPTVKLPRDTVGAIDSLKIVKQYLKNDNKKLALQVSLRQLKLAKKNKDSTLIYKYTRLIAKIFSRTNNYKKALNYYQKAFTYNHVDSLEKYMLHLSISEMFYKTNQQDSAVKHLQKIIDIPSTNHKFDGLKASAYANLSGIQVEQNDLLHAEINAYNAMEIHEKNNDLLSLAAAKNNLISVFLEQNRFKDAKKETLEALELIKNNKSKRAFRARETLYDNLSWALYRLGDVEAYTYQEKSFHIRDSIQNAQINNILTEIESRFNAETIKKQEQLKTAEERRKTAEERRKAEHAKNINIILIVISLSLLIASWLIYRYLKLRQKNLKLEFKQEKLIQKNKLESLQSEAREKILNATLDGKESERKMIAETLHHSVSSLLSSASLHLQASKMQLKKNYPEEIDKAQLIINEAADKIRNLSHSLVSSVLLKFGLAYAIQDLCDKYSNSTLHFHCDCVGIKRYAQDFELKINSIIDELLNNIIKHSNADNAEIKIEEKHNRLVISILDDGNGFNPDDKLKDSGLGLRQIETRINKMRGIFTINSSPNDGTSIFISVPIKPLENTTN